MCPRCPTFPSDGHHPNFKKKRSQRKRAILGATLGIALTTCHAKTQFSEPFSERLSYLVGSQISPQILGAFFSTLASSLCTRTTIRKLEKDLAVPSLFWETFSGKFRRSGNIPPDFPAARHVFPARDQHFSGKKNRVLRGLNTGLAAGGW